MVAWLKTRLTPKVLIATQTKVIEAIADEEGDLVPVTPTISVASSVDQIWPLMAILHTPAVSASCFYQHFGAGLSPNALKLRAADVGDLPMPADIEQWELGAKLLREVAGRAGLTRDRQDAIAFGQVMNAAYGVTSPDVINWWNARLPA